MCSKRFLLGCLGVVVLLLLEIRVSIAQLRNGTLWEQGTDDLDYFDQEHYNVNGTRIVGGKRVKIRQVPWQIALYNNGAFICGGSIISVDWVLTAAHCVEGGGNFAIRAGSSYVRRGGQGRLARSVYITISYTSNTYNTDIALIRVRTSFNITRNVRPIALARSNRRLPGKFFVTGWGTRSENGGRAFHLRGATVRLVSRNECRRRYQNLASITNYMICATGPGKDACYGDSGGPLVRRRIQYGIVSFGIGCARSEYPGVHTNIRRLNRWIRRVIRRRGGKRPKFR